MLCVYYVVSLPAFLSYFLAFYWSILIFLRFYSKIEEGNFVVIDFIWFFCTFTVTLIS